jgi:WD40 repeat protein
LQATLNRVRRALYGNRILLIQRYAEDNRHDVARELLEACDADLRGWEWHYLHRLLYPQPARWFSCQPRDLAFSPDGKLLAVGGDRGRWATVWDSLTGKLLRGLGVSNDDKDNRVAFSPDSKRLATTSYGSFGDDSWGDLAVWDLATGKELLTKNIEAFDVAFSADGALLAYESGGVTVVDAATGQEIRTFSDSRFVFGPSGRLVTASWPWNVPGARQEVKLWDTTTWKNLLTLKGPADGVWQVMLSADGQRIATVSPQTITVWDPTAANTMATS